MIDAFLFDFDGVVANVNIDKALAAARPYISQFKLPPEQILTEFFYHNPQNLELDLGLAEIRAVREAMRPKLWRGTSEDWLMWWEAVEDAYQVSPDMQEWLSELRGSFRLGMLTDNHLGFRKWLEKRSDVQNYFDVVICSAEVGLKKPAEPLFQIATKHLKSTFATMIYLDDDLKNINAAQAQGITSIHFRSVSQAKRVLDNWLRATKTPEENEP